MKLIRLLFLFSLFAQAPSFGSMPAKVQYHFGKKAYLVEDAIQDNIPLSAWNRFIMGDERPSGDERPKTPPVRRGFYISPDIRNLAGWGEWFVIIHLHETCLSSDSRFDPTKLRSDKKFIKWLKASPKFSLEDVSRALPTNDISLIWSEVNSLLESPDKIIQKCEFDIEENRTTRPMILPRFKPGPATITSDICEAVFLKYMHDTDVKIAKDPFWQSESWYIRDRGCFKEIRGEEHEIFEWFRENPKYLKIPLFRNIYEQVN